MRRRNSPREQRRLQTLRERYTEDERRGWASKAGQASGGFDSDSARKANAIRWAAYRAAKAEKEKQQSKGE